MTHALVTGSAGFIGSHLTDRLLADGVQVTGVDAFTDYYDPALKRRNLESARRQAGFTLLELDLGSADLAALPAVDVVFHQAAQPGVRASWGREFATYTQQNVLATQRLLERYKDTPLERFIYASSSSIYGDAESYPTALGLPTVLTVAASDAAGLVSPAQARADLAAAVQGQATDAETAPAVVAATRVAALSARLVARDATLAGAALKQRILALTAPLPAVIGSHALRWLPAPDAVERR